MMNDDIRPAAKANEIIIIIIGIKKKSVLTSESRTIPQLLELLVTTN